MLMGLPAITLCQVGQLGFYLFPWAPMAHLLLSCFFHSFLPSSSFTIGFFLLLGILSKMGINTIQSLKTKNKNFLHSHCPTHHFHYLTFNCLLGFTLYCSLNFLFLIYKIYKLVIFVVGFTFFFFFSFSDLSSNWFIVGFFFFLFLI